MIGPVMKKRLTVRLFTCAQLSVSSTCHCTFKEEFSCQFQTEKWALCVGGGAVWVCVRVFDSCSSLFRETFFAARSEFRREQTQHPVFDIKTFKI